MSRVVVGCAGLLLAPVAARASTVGVDPSPEPGSLSEVLHYAAAPGEQNVVTARVARGGSDGSGRWTISDTGATIVALEPCTSIDAHTVNCPAHEDRFIEFADFALGDLDDRFDSASSGEEPLGTVRTDGGPGNDRLIGGNDVSVFDGGEGNDFVAGGSPVNALNGGPGDDRLTGAGGPDELDGGGGRDELYGKGGRDQLSDGDRDGAVGDAAPGPDLLDGGHHGCCSPGDRVSYAHRSARIVVDLSDARPDGEAGEGDALRGIESIEGGRGDDRLEGDDRANAILGKVGRDRLIGRGGDDSIEPGTGGGPIACGDGLDIVRRGGPDDALDAGCEVIFEPRLGENLLPAYPRANAGGGLTYIATCPENSEEEGPSIFRCSCDLQIREANGRHRLLADGHLPLGRWDTRPVALRTTPLGARLASRRQGVRATLRLRVQYKDRYGRHSRTLCWGIRLRLPSGR